MMAGESSDVSHKEQVVVCIRWVDDELIAHEEFVGIKPVERTTAEDIVLVLTETLTEMHLRIDDCWGRCYDGASTMSGAKSGVATRIKTLNEKCLFTHCYGHVLNLSVKGAFIIIIIITIIIIIIIIITDLFNVDNLKYPLQKTS